MFSIALPTIFISTFQPTQNLIYVYSIVSGILLMNDRVRAVHKAMIAFAWNAQTDSLEYIQNCGFYGNTEWHEVITSKYRCGRLIGARDRNWDSADDEGWCWTSIDYAGIIQYLKIPRLGKYVLYMESDISLFSAFVRSLTIMSNFATLSCQMAFIFPKQTNYFLWFGFL